MSYTKRYNLKTLTGEIEELRAAGKKFIDVEDLFFTIGFNMKDVNIFYTKHVKHRMRYEERR